jgi:signal recognition particle subunit SRP19
MRKQEKYIIWPQYFDQNRTRSQGRKIPKNQAQPTPRLEEIQKAAQRLGLTAEIVPESAYPSTPWLKTGIALVSKKGTKLETMRKIARELGAQRAKQST